MYITFIYIYAYTYTNQETNLTQYGEMNEGGMK